MFREKISNLREAWKREEVRSISRRYFISNGFDGTLTAVGIAVGSYLSGVPDGLTVFKVAMGGAVGLATSGVWSVWEIEKAEKLAELHDLEKNMLEELEGTKVHEEKKQGRVINAFMSGSGPLIGILLPSSVFLLEEAFLTMFQATIGAIAVGVTVLFAFGMYMANISEQKWWKAGIRMGLAGLVVALLNILLPG